MTAFTTSLRCLGKPVTLLSIGLLFVNDHLLKAAMPSALTGKLSDIAGLFFFPFLLAVILSTLFYPFRLRDRFIATLAFISTIFWFTLIKVLPWANSLTVSWLSDMLDSPVQIIRDPTDLVALVAVWPAWRLWHHQEREPAKHHPDLIAYFAFFLAAFATLATSCPPPARVTRLELVNRDLYADLNRFEVATSSDGGRTWNQVTDVPDPISAQLEQKVTLPVTKCVEGEPQTCYRIMGDEQVESSLDGGLSWQIAWQIPPGRRRFMLALHDNSQSVCKTGFDPGPYDLALLSNENGSHTVIVAMGGEGVLVRTPAGNWERVGILRATPTPFQLTGFNLVSAINVTQPESWILPVAALLVFWILSLWEWQYLLSRDETFREQINRFIARTAKATFFILIIAFLLIVVLESLALLLFPLAALFVILLPFAIWARISRTHPDRNTAGLLWKSSFLTGFGIFPVSWFPYLLWAYGIFDSYNFALILNIAIILLVISTCILYVIKMIRKAQKTEDHEAR